LGINLGTAAPSAYYLGSNAVSAVYLGGTLVWPPSDYYFSQVVTLLHGETLADSSPYNRTVTANTAAASLSTTQAKFGSKSLYSSNTGSNGSFTIGATAKTFTAGNYDFVVEWWQYLSDITVMRFILSGSADDPFLAWNYASAGYLSIYPSYTLSAASSLIANQWQYIAVARVNGVYRLYVDGVFTGQATLTSDRGNWGKALSLGIAVGAGSASAVTNNSYIDELRITEKTNRGYTGSTISVPTASFPDSGPMSVPLEFGAQAANASATLTWTAPFYAGVSAITDYSVQYSTNSGSTWTSFPHTASTATSATVTGLTNGTAYVFRVAGISAAETGTYTAASPSVTPSASASTAFISTPGTNNFANYGNSCFWDGSDATSPAGNVTSVGTNGATTAYGMRDMQGSVRQWASNLQPWGTQTADGRGQFGEGFTGIACDRSQADSRAASSYYSYTSGFRVASASNPYSLTNFAPVGDISNAADTIISPNPGSVSYSYYMGIYTVTNTEYAAFLNAVAQTDPNGLYVSEMADMRGGINRSGTSGSYTYSLKTDYGNKPVTNVSWLNAARYCNWLHNNKPTGSQSTSTTEDGAYTMSASDITKNSGAKYALPTVNEWWKAAYYKGGSTSAGYWKYPTQSDTQPGKTTCDTHGVGNRA